MGDQRSCNDCMTIVMCTTMYGFAGNLHKHTGFVASTSAFSFSTSSLTMWRCPVRAAMWTGDQPVCSWKWNTVLRILNMTMEPYFLVRKECMRRVKDVKVVRGAEVGSDHYLVLMKIQLWMAGRQECIRSVRKERIKVEKLRDAQVKRVYQTNMARRCREVKHALQWKGVCRYK